MLIEFALVLPVMLLLAAGVYVFGSLLRANAALNRLVMQYAISFADCSDTSSGVCGTELAEYETTAALNNIAPQLSPSSLTLTMAQAIMSGTTPTVEYPVGGSLTAAQISALQAVVPSGQTGVVVTASYLFTPVIFAPLIQPFIGTGVTLSYTMAQLK